jgi:methionine aminotransferase
MAVILFEVAHINTLIMIYSKLFSIDLGLVATLSENARLTGAIDLAGNYLSDDLPSSIATDLKNLPDDMFNRVVSTYGLIELRQEISNKMHLQYDRTYCPDKEITITNGSNHALFAAMTAVLGEGDEVILFEPAAENYLPIIMLCGARPIYVTLKEPDFHIDWEEVTRMVTGNTKMIIINTPHNPTGMVLSELDMLRLQKVINGTRITVLSDECYEHLIYDGASHQSVALYPKLAECSIIINSMSQSCRVAWPVGYCVAPADLMQQIRYILHVTDGGHFAPLQMLLAQCLAKKEIYRDLAQRYSQKRDRFNLMMTEQTRFVPVATNGTCYQLFSYAKISDERDKEFARRLFDEVGVATVPFSTFFHEKQKRSLLRFNFGRPDELLDKAVEALSRL